MKTKLAAVLTMGVSLLSNSVFADDAKGLKEEMIDHGRYVVKITGCNDCHTPGYVETAGALPEDQWLTGNPVGFKGPWGVTYPVNLRLKLAGMTEQEWVKFAHSFEARPPMPWFNLRDMGETDLRAVYQFIRSLGPKGEPAPAFVPPEKVAQYAYINFVPEQVKTQ